MKNLYKIVLVFLIVPVLLFAFNAKAVSVDDNSSLIAQLQAQIESLIKQIIALIQRSAQIKPTASLPVPVNFMQNTNHVSTQVNTNTQINSGSSSSSDSKTATLTVNAIGVTAYVSINNAPQFAYSGPITLNNGDIYSVTASSSGSTTKCNGTASSGGSYTCNINVNN
jgi:molybdopterin converting factor small subunit